MLRLKGTVVGLDNRKTAKDNPFVVVQVFQQIDGRANMYQFRDYQNREYKLNEKIDVPVFASAWVNDNNAAMISFTRMKKDV